jgi:serine/threonine protein kinase
MPFGADANNVSAIAKEIAERPLTFTYDDYGRVNAVTRDFLDALLMKNPKDRLTLAEIKAHEYFNGM